MSIEYRYQIEYHNVTIGLRDTAVHIHNDEHLLDYLQRPGNKALSLAEHVRGKYLFLFGKPLDISGHSLAIEIIGHVFSDKVADAVLDKVGQQSRGPVASLFGKVRERMEVIDCGEATCDSNRFVWDALVPLRKMIYAVAKQ